MSSEASNTDLEVLSRIIEELKKVDSESQKRIMQSVSTFLGLDIESGISVFERSETKANNASSAVVPLFSESQTLSPKEFLLEKQPRSDVERIACLAYYLTHYRETPYFKTLDLSKLNTEAAQPKFSNAAYSTNNALKQRYLAHGPSGQKQISASGEQFVSTLPDRDSARAAMSATTKSRARRKSGKATKNAASGQKKSA